MDGYNYLSLEIKGKQYKAEKGGLLKVDKMTNTPGDSVEFDSVLLVSEGENTRIGAPYLEGIKIKAKVEEQTKGKKLRIIKYKRKGGYRRETGHRQQYTCVRVEEILGL